MGIVSTNYSTKKVSGTPPCKCRLSARMNYSENTKRTMLKYTVIDGNEPLPLTTEHSIDYRISMSIFGQQIYFVFLSGCDQRAMHRVIADDQLRSFSTYVLKVVLVLLFLVCASLMLLGGGVVGLYVLKSSLGIDVFEGHSVLHDLIY